MNNYYGDFLLNKTVRCRFNTVKSDGTPITLTTGSVSVSKDGTIVTPTGGVTLGVDVGGVVGKHHVLIDMSVDTSVFTAGSEYSVSLAGSSAVNSIPVLGEIVGEWSVQNRSVTVDANGRIQVQSGTTAGQIDITNGVVKANLAQILGTVLTETAGQMAAAFNKWFDVSSPTGTVNSLPTATPGTNGGLATVDANNAVKVQSGTGANQVSLTGGKVAVASLSNGSIDSNVAPALANLDATISGVPVAILDAANGVETGLTLRQSMRAIIAALFGLDTVNTGTSTVSFKRRDGATVAISITYDTNGNRTASQIGTL